MQIFCLKAIGDYFTFVKPIEFSALNLWEFELWDRNELTRFRFRLWKKFGSGSISGSISGTGSRLYIKKSQNILYKILPFNVSSSIVSQKVVISLLDADPHPEPEKLRFRRFPVSTTLAVSVHTYLANAPERSFCEQDPKKISSSSSSCSTESTNSGVLGAIIKNVKNARNVGMFKRLHRTHREAQAAPA